MRSLAGKNVLITGGHGFIGSHLAIRLLRGGARVALDTIQVPRTEGGA